MEASQPRVKPARASEPEQSLAQQSPSSVGDANLWELPQRPLSVAQPTLPPPKRKSQAKGRRASQRKPVIAFRQHWVTPGKLIADGIQQWESQAEWINQQLAERTISQSEARSPQPIDQGEAGLEQSIAAVPQPHTQGAVQSPMLEDEEADRLQSKLAQVRQIVSDLGSAIAEGGTWTEENQPIQPIQLLSAISKEAAIDDQTGSQAAKRAFAEAEQEAVQTAARLRHLAKKARSTPPASDLLTPDLLTPDLQSPDLLTPDLQLSREFIQSQNQAALRVKRSQRRRKFRLIDLLRLPQQPVDRVVDGLTWIVLAGVVRIGVRLLLGVFPVLSPVAIGLLLLPVAIGLFLLLFVPKAGYLPVYRLFLVTLGLLLGGNL